MTRDFTPLWGIAATVDAFEDLASVPSDYRPVVLFGGVPELPGQLEARIGERQAQAVVEVLQTMTFLALATAITPALLARVSIGRLDGDRQPRDA